MPNPSYETDPLEGTKRISQFPLLKNCQPNLTGPIQNPESLIFKLHYSSFLYSFDEPDESLVLVKLEQAVRKEAERLEKLKVRN